MNKQLKYILIILSLISSFMLVCLQPSVHPTVIESQKFRYSNIHQFRILWEYFCFPKEMKDILILIFNIIILSTALSLILNFCKSLKLRAFSFGVCYYLIHLILYLIYRDGFIPLNGALPTVIFILIIYHSFPIEKEDYSKIGNEFRGLFIQEKIITFRHLINILITITIAIGVSVLAFNFNYMEKIFSKAGKGNYEVALYLAQRSITTIVVWSCFLFFFILLPIMYKKLNDLIDLFKE